MITISTSQSTQFIQISSALNMSMSVLLMSSIWRGFYFGNEPPEFTDKRYVQSGDPRHAGITVTYTFR